MSQQHQHTNARFQDRVRRLERLEDAAAMEDKVTKEYDERMLRMVTMKHELMALSMANPKRQEYNYLFFIKTKKRKHTLGFSNFSKIVHTSCYSIYVLKDKTCNDVCGRI